MRDNKTLSESNIFHFEKQMLRRFYKPSHLELFQSVVQTLRFLFRSLSMRARKQKQPAVKKSVNPIKRGDEWV